jgi:heme/copper-type cytochrome/quinol oxidase subunit 2
MILALVIVVVFVLLVWFWYEVRTAPFGWEDEQGFHEERKEE